MDFSAELAKLVCKVSEHYGDSFFPRLYNRTESNIVFWNKDGDKEKLDFWIRKLNTENENFLFLKRFLCEKKKTGKRITKKDIMSMEKNLILKY